MTEVNRSYRINLDPKFQGSETMLSELYMAAIVGSWHRICLGPWNFIMVKGFAVYGGGRWNRMRLHNFTSSRQSPNKIKSHAQRATKIKGEVFVRECLRDWSLLLHLSLPEQKISTRSTQETPGISRTLGSSKPDFKLTHLGPETRIVKNAVPKSQDSWTYIPGNGTNQCLFCKQQVMNGTPPAHPSVFDFLVVQLRKLSTDQGFGRVSISVVFNLDFDWCLIVMVPSRELTYPTLGKGKSSSKVTFDGIS